MRQSLRLVAGLLVLSSAGRFAAAAPVVHAVQIPTNLFGHFDQNDEDVLNGPVACGPTATANSFSYLQTRFGVTGIYDDAHPFDTINSLETYMNLTPYDPDTGAGGVSPEGLVNGKTQYLHDKGMDGTITVESQIDPAFHAGGTTPTWQFLLDQLTKGQDVEIGFLWWDANANVGAGAYAGGHIVTATGFTFSDTNGDDVIDPGEAATLSFIDPWGGVDLTGTITMAGGYMRLAYTGGAAGSTTLNNQDDNPDNASLGDIQFIAAESFVPEPSSLALLACAAYPALTRSRRRRV